jgi:hypothetical protein
MQQIAQNFPQFGYFVKIMDPKFPVFVLVYKLSLTSTNNQGGSQSELAIVWTVETSIGMWGQMLE